MEKTGFNQNTGDCIEVVSGFITCHGDGRTDGFGNGQRAGVEG